MVHIKITKGLDIPMSGAPQGAVKPLIPAGEANQPALPRRLALSLQEFEEVKFRILVKVGQVVKIGEPLAEDKSTQGRMFVSPAAGVVQEVHLGAKRHLQRIVIDVANQETSVEFPVLNPQTATREALLERLLQGGAFATIRSRPFNLLADPKKPPRNIFVKALESAPCTPPAEYQVAGHEKEFQAGLDTLSKLTDGSVHLVYRQGTACKAFSQAAHVKTHSAQGPHPIGNFSVHIQQIDPIRRADDVVWTVTALDVVNIGHLMLRGRCYTGRIVSVAGAGILPDSRGFFSVRAGFPIASLIAGRVQKGPMRIISGDPLMGKKVDAEEFLGFSHTACCVIPEQVKREFLHFFGIGLRKYSFSKAYLSGHLDPASHKYAFTSSQHGEHRAFVDSSLYDKVMPLDVPTMLLTKAVMAQDFELAETLGLLEVDSEDFALPTFVCPSKVEMCDIIKQGLRQYAHEVLA